jgi:DNA-binding XRE family transcriptional regulator
VDSINTDGQEEAVFMPSAEARSEGEMVQEALEFQRLIKLAQSFFTPEYMQELAQSRDLNLEESAIEISALMAILGLLEDYLAKAAEDAEERAFLKPILGEVNEWEANAEKLVPELYKQNMKPVFVKAFSEIPNLKTDILTYMMQHVSAWAAGEALRTFGDKDVTRDAFESAYKQILSEQDRLYDWLANALSNYCSEWARSILDEAEKLNLNLKALRDLIGFKVTDSGTATVEGEKREAAEALTEQMLSVPSASFYSVLQEAVATRDFPDVEGIPFPVKRITRGDAQGIAQIRPLAMDGYDYFAPEQIKEFGVTMREYRDLMSPLDVDVMDAMAAIYVQRTSGPNEGNVRIYVDELLAMRGLKPKKSGSGTRGGYRPDQRSEHMSAVYRAQNLWLDVEITEPGPKGGRRKPKKRRVQSRLFALTERTERPERTGRTGQERLDGEMDVESFTFTPGPILAHYLHGPGRQTALMNGKILAYDPVRQAWEKNIGRYLSYLWRTRAHSGTYSAPLRVLTLLERTGYKLTPRRGTWIRERFEKALDTLAEDGFISAWQYSRWDEGATERRNWFQNWLQATVIIEPPDTIEEHYHKIEQPVEAAPKRIAAPKQGTAPKGEGLGPKLKARRKQLRLTQMQAAEQLGIGQPYFSQLERGKASPSGDIMKRILEWLGD